MTKLSAFGEFGFIDDIKSRFAGAPLPTGWHGIGDDCAVIPKDEFELLMESDWQIARKFITLLAKDVTEKEQLLLGLAYNSLRKKVAEALILLSRKYKDAIKISRDNLAAIAGTATESLIRTLGEFRQEKLIEISEGYITIVNEAKLKTMLN